MILLLWLACGPEPTLTAPPPLAEGARAQLGQPAPDFVLPNTENTLVRLSDLQGKVRVLEWFNPDCPFINHAHGRGPLESAPAAWSERGVQWLVINSNTPGSTGSSVSQNSRAAKKWELPGAVLMDQTGAVGKAYGAKVTPHIFVIDADGVLVYEGAPDNAPLGATNGGEALIDHLTPTLESVLAGRAPPVARTTAYGCTVKYGG